MSHISDAYDLTLAVNALRTLWYEVSDNEDRLSHVWLPTKQALSEYSVRLPRRLLCLAGGMYVFPAESTGRMVNVYLCNDRKQIICLGTVINETGERLDRAREIQRLQTCDRREARRLLQVPLETIIRDQFLWKIPVEDDDLTEAVLTEAVRRYLKSFELSLAVLPIEWLSSEESLALVNTIKQEAQRTAKVSVRYES